MAAVWRGGYNANWADTMYGVPTGGGVDGGGVQRKLGGHHVWCPYGGGVKGTEGSFGGVRALERAELTNHCDFGTSVI
ncbi:MAG: hypothetical protein RR505_12295 [Raoultibacter sp.]